MTAESEEPSAFSITDEEVDKVLCRGSGFAGGKIRIYAMYQQQGDAKERADFLKNEYGTGGHSYTFDDGSHGFVDYDAKGLFIRSYGHDKEVRLKWSEVDRRLSRIVDHGGYLNAEELARYEQIEADFAGDVPMPSPAHRFPSETPIITENSAPMPEEETQNETEASAVPVDKENALNSANANDFRVGDTLTLDGTEYVIENVGLFDVHLRDPQSAFPIFRAESKENLERLLGRNEVRERESEDQTVDPLESDVETSTQVETKLEIPAQNFRIIDEHLGEGSPKEKFRANMDAIHTLQTLEQEDRNATPEEQQILSKYVGWGGLADAFDERKSAWSSEYQELKETLSDEEYIAARASTLNAHFTSPTVIKAIYDAVERMGFEHGNVLEPSMGVGNFFGMMPEEMQENSRLYGVELDSITGRIAQKLYPTADITVAGFETTDRRDFYDLAIGNVPFGNYRVADKPYDKLGFSIHNYFFAKSLDQVRAGGVVAFVTSRYTMDSKNPDARRYMAQRADFLGAIRLPNNAFKANAGTEVVSDISSYKERSPY